MSREADPVDRSEEALRAARQALALLEVVCGSESDLLRAAAIRSRAALSVALDALQPTGVLPRRPDTA